LEKALLAPLRGGKKGKKENSKRNPEKGFFSLLSQKGGEGERNRKKRKEFRSQKKSTLLSAGKRGKETRRGGKGEERPGRRRREGKTFITGEREGKEKGWG